MNPDSAAPPIFQFHNYFDVLLADPADVSAPERVAERIDQCRHLRYMVYCREFGFEREEDCPGQRERDAYDNRSLHCLMVHRASGIPAGTVRLVIGDEPEFRMPFWAHCGDSLFDEHPNHPRHHQPVRSAEISRLAVAADFRRRAGEHATPLGQIEQDFAQIEQRTYPLISLALFLVASSLTVMIGRWDAYAIMEPRLARRLSLAGLLFERVGSDIDYHGMRASFYTNPEMALSALDRIPGMRPMYDLVYQRLREQMLPERLQEPNAVPWASPVVRRVEV